MALNGSDNTVSSRRLVTLITMLIGVIVDAALITLAFMVALNANVNNKNAIDVMYVLIKLTLIHKACLFLLIGVITWQNINDTAKIVKGLPGNIEELEAKVSESAVEIRKEGVTIP